MRASSIRRAASTRRGSVLVDDGVIAAAGAAALNQGAPEGAEVIDCARHVPSRPGLVDMRAFIGEPGAEHRETLTTASEAAAAGGVTTIVMHARHRSGHRRPRARRFRAAPRPRHGDRQHPSRRRRSPRASPASEMTEFGLLQEAGAVAFTDGAHGRRKRAGDAPRADLCARLRRSAHATMSRIRTSSATAS